MVYLEMFPWAQANHRHNFNEIDLLNDLVLGILVNAITLSEHGGRVLSPNIRKLGVQPSEDRSFTPPPLVVKS